MENFNNVPSSGTFGSVVSVVNQNFALAKEAIDKLAFSKSACMGFYETSSELNDAHPTPTDGDWALVGNSAPFNVYVANDGSWVDSGVDYNVSVDNSIEINGLGGYVVLDSVQELPASPSNPNLGYLIGTHLYVYVGTGGDTSDGKYQDCGEFRGPEGKEGKPGADGHDGVSLGEVAIVNNLTEGGSEKVLSAEQGKQLNSLALQGRLNKSFNISPNLWDERTVNGYIDITTGDITGTSGDSRTTAPIDVKPNTYYYLSGRSGSNGGVTTIRCLDAQGNAIKVLAPSNGTAYTNYRLPNADASDHNTNGMFKTPADAVSVQITLTSTSYVPPIMLEECGTTYDPSFSPSEYSSFYSTPTLKDEALPSDLQTLLPDMQTIQENIDVTYPYDDETYTNLNSSRWVGDKNMQFRDGDILKAVVFPRLASTKTSTVLMRVYDSGNHIKGSEQTLGVYGDGGTFLVPNPVTLAAGDCVAIKYAPYGSATTTEQRFFDFRPSGGGWVNYIYGISVVVERAINRIDELENDIQELQEEIAGISEPSKSLKILFFGNSFTQDSVCYSPFILKSLAPKLDIKIGIAYIGGSSLAKHCANFTGESQIAGGTTINPENYTLYSYDSQATGAASGKWTQTNNVNVDTILASKEWNIVCFQQNSSNAGRAISDYNTYYAPFIYKIIKSLNAKIIAAEYKTVKVGFVLTHGIGNTVADTLANWTNVQANTEMVVNTAPISHLFAYGTSVQNLRTTSCGLLGDDGSLSVDNTHLQDGIGCMAANYYTCLKILEIAGIDAGIIGEQTRVDTTWLTAHKIPGQNLGDGVIGINDANCLLAQASAVAAMRDPYHVTDISILENEQLPSS